MSRWLKIDVWSLLLLALLVVICYFVLTSAGVVHAQFVSGRQEVFLRSKIPLAEFREDPRLLIYTRQSMPRVYQHDGCAHDPNYNISGEWPEQLVPDGRGGNWAVLFPFSTPAGVRRSTGVTHFTFLRLPPGRAVAYYFEGGRWQWLFPIGSVVGEVLCLRSPEGRDMPFEVRIKTRETNDWVSSVFRPFPTVDHLATAIQLIRPEWWLDPQLSQAMDELTGPRELRVLKLVDTHHVYPALRSRASVDTLPALPADLVTDLLTGFEFDDATGTTWRGQTCFAPTSDQEFSIVPRHYDGTFLGTNDKSCRECHRTAGHDGDEIDPRSPKQKYGHIPGGDEIFSFHPFHPACISHNGVNLRPMFRDQVGVIESFHPARHDREHYRRLLP